MDLKGSLLVGLLLIAAITDLAQRKVYNWLIVPALVAGLAWNTVEMGWPGLGFSLLGLLVGGLLFLPFFVWGGMGAGDIKLMAVVGAFGGAWFAVQAWFYTALAGGALALVLLLARGELLSTLKNLGIWLGSLLGSGRKSPPFSEKNALPYAAVILAGTVAALFLPPWLNW
jgi:prepilin peptidase CpaA